MPPRAAHMVPVHARSRGADERTEESAGGQTPIWGQGRPPGQRVPGVHSVLENCTRRLEYELERAESNDDDDDGQNDPTHEPALLRAEEEEQSSPLHAMLDTLRTDTAEEENEKRDDDVDVTDGREEEHCEPTHGVLDGLNEDEMRELCDVAELFGGGHVPFAGHTWPSGQSVPGMHAPDDDTLDSAPQDDGGQLVSVVYC